MTMHFPANQANKWERAQAEEQNSVSGISWREIPPPPHTQFLFRPTSKSRPVRCNMCVIVAPSTCFIVHTTTSEELPLISRVSESPRQRRRPLLLLPAAAAAVLNAFLLRAVLCPSDSGSFATSSFIIPVGINGFCWPAKGFFFFCHSEQMKTT